MSPPQKKKKTMKKLTRYNWCFTNRWETIRCGVHAICLHDLLQISHTLPHQPIWTWDRWRIWCPHLLQTTPKPLATVLTLRGLSTAPLVWLIYIHDIFIIVFIFECFFSLKLFISGTVQLHTELFYCVSTALTSFAPSIPGSPVYLHSHAGVGAPSFSRQHFSPHPWSASTSGKYSVFYVLNKNSVVW